MKISENLLFTLKVIENRFKQQKTKRKTNCKTVRRP